MNAYTKSESVTCKIFCEQSWSLGQEMLDMVRKHWCAEVQSGYVIPSSASAPDPSRGDPCPAHHPACTASLLPSPFWSSATWFLYLFPTCQVLSCFQAFEPVHPSAQNSVLPRTWRIPTQRSGLSEMQPHAGSLCSPSQQGYMLSSLPPEHPACPHRTSQPAAEKLPG